MKVIRLFLKSAGIFLFLLLMAVTSLFAQPDPTYLAELRNDVQVDAYTWEFDLYLLRTGSTVFEYGSMQFGINIDPAVRGTGTMTFILIPGTSELNAPQIPAANKFSFAPATNTMRMTGTPGPGAGSGTIISDVSPGTRFGRFRLTNTIPFGIVKPSPVWWFSNTGGYWTKLNAYVGGLIKEITVQASHTTNNMVNPFLNKPLTAYNVTGSGGYCAGAPGLLVGLDGSEVGVTYTLTPGGATFAGTGSAFTFTGFQTAGNYSVTAVRNGTFINGPMTGTAVITITPLPSAAGTIAGTSTVTQGSMGVPYSVPPIANATSYVWAYTGTGVTINGTGAAVTLDFAGNATSGQLSVYGHNICGDGTISSFFDILVQSGVTPPIAFNVTGSGSYCAGGIGLPVGLDGSELGVTYTITPGGATAPGTGTPISFGNRLAGVYTVSGTGPGGTTPMTGSAIIVENPLPVATITAGGPTTFCTGGSVVLTSSLGGSYLWSTGATTQAITVNATGAYSVTVTTLGCSATSAVTNVTVNPLPVASITPSGATTFCAGGSVNLTASVADSYLWSTGATTQTIAVSATGSYTVTVTTLGCSATSAPTNVTVNPLPVAAITPSGATTFCAGGSVNLTASLAGSYLWSTGATTQTITVNATGAYSVTVTSLGCSATSAPTNVTVNPLPVATITPSGATTFCAGGSVDLTASVADSYLWSTGATTQTITVNATGAYSVTVTTLGCSATSAPTNVTVNPLPVASITPSGPTTFCAGGSVNLTASVAGSYVWSTGATTQTITVNATGAYSVTVTTLGCSATSAPTNVTVNPYPVATITPGGPTTFCAGGSVNLTASVADSYLWSTGATTQTITANATGSFSVTVTTLGCSATSAPVIVTIIAAGSSTTWNGISNDWNDPANWTNGVPLACVDVILPAGKANYPTLSAAAVCHNIFFGSTAAGTATLLDNGFLTVGGTATVQRYYSAGGPDWHLVSSPIANATANVFYDEYLQSFNEGTGVYTDIIAPATPLNVMEGYALYDPVVATTDVDVFNGTLNQGTKSHGITAAGTGWNLLGNPFVSSINWEAVTIPAGMSNEVHYIDAATGNDYSYVKGTGGTGSQYVPPMQGFFVSATAAGSLAVGDGQRSHLGGNLFYKSDNPRLVVLEAAGANYSDQTWIHFNDQAGVEHDGVYDAYKRISTSNPLLPQIYSTTPAGTKMSVNGMPQTSTVPVGFTAVKSGNFTISALQKGEFTKVTLEDLFNGTFTNLLTDSYSFTYTSGDQGNRFLLHFNGVSVNENQADLLNIYSIQKDVYVSVPSNKIGNVKILNMLGQEIAQTKIVDVLTKLTVNQIGIYVVQVKMDNGKIYTKKVIIR